MKSGFFGGDMEEVIMKMCEDRRVFMYFVGIGQSQRRKDDETECEAGAKNQRNTCSEYTAKA